MSSTIKSITHSREEKARSYAPTANVDTVGSQDTFIEMWHNVSLVVKVVD